jgi:precorrin-8X/cobalt-precorrin-8 methylmutase
VIVDWSAAAQPKTGRDSIWVCRLGPDGESVYNPPTRHAAKGQLADMLAGASANDERVLLGFDFPFGYPAGFAARLGLAGTPWRAVWQEIGALIEDHPDNRNNRFAVGAELNRRVSGGQFPFWGCPAARAGEFLAPRHHNRHKTEHLAERRLIDCWMVGAQPCWKLAYTGSVGSQVLTGIPVVQALRDDPRWADRARIWPFETGLRLPDDTRIVFAEVWPSWWNWRPTQEPGEVNDRAQVRHVARLFAEADRKGELCSWFTGAPNLTGAERQAIEGEEAWTLGVTEPKLPPKSSFSPVRRPLPNPPLPGLDPGITAEGSVGTAARQSEKPAYTYLRDPAAIYRRSFTLVRAEADLARFPAALRPLAVRLAHAAGDVSILGDLVWSRGAIAAGRRALASGAVILVDSAMVAAGISRELLPAGNEVICTLRDPTVPELAVTHRTTRSAAAVELWRPHLAGSVVAIGNAPTALFRLLEILMAGGDWPALILGFPVGFVGAAKAKAALLGFERCPAYITLKGRRGGSALAAAAVNALCGKGPAAEGRKCRAGSASLASATTGFRA